jgi:hypothetical protein
MSSCAHRWSLIDIRSGYLVVEGCHHCGARGTYFSTEIAPPVEEYQDGPHHWQYMVSAQAVSFNLRCDVCGEVVDLSDVQGLMLCTCENPDCEIGRMAHEMGRNTSIYVAMCCDSTHKTNPACVSDRGIAALNEYFNQRLREGPKKIVVLPCKMCGDVDYCPGIVIADSGLIEL